MEERRMRSCLHCQVGIGIMTLEEWKSRFVQREERCPICHKLAGIEPEVVIEEEWIPIIIASLKYNVSKERLRKMVAQGNIPTKENGFGRLLLGNALAKFGVRDG